MTPTNTSTSRQQLKVFKILCAVLTTFMLFSVKCSAYVIKQKDMSATIRATDNKRNEVTTERQYTDVDTIATKPGGDVLGLLSLTTGLRASAKRDASNEGATMLSVDKSVQTSTGVDEIGTTVTKEPDEEPQCNSARPDDQLLIDLSLRSKRLRTSSDYEDYIYPAHECNNTVLENFKKEQLLRFRTTCPFDVKENTDYERYPMTLKYVKCYCRYGITINEGNATFSSDYKCSYVMYDVPVLRRGDCVDGKYKWTQDIESLPIACVTEVLPIVN